MVSAQKPTTIGQGHSRDHKRRESPTSTDLGSEEIDVRKSVFIEERTLQRGEEGMKVGIKARDGAVVI